MNSDSDMFTECDKEVEETSKLTRKYSFFITPYSISVS